MLKLSSPPKKLDSPKSRLGYITTRKALVSIVLKSSHKKETEMGTETEALRNMRENLY